MYSKRPLMTAEEFKEKRREATQKVFFKFHDVFEEHTQYVLDPYKADRKASSTCRVCFYGSRLAGSAFSSANCRVCDTLMKSGCTYIPPMCGDCALDNGVCKDCLCDINESEKSFNSLKRKYKN